ncbi:18180_t:CDS:1 [Funneliformis geosporum]|uniref:12590_t:CDS:1 n=1 Tax=Funneliformis geosporum TaxID=1117311 RepID=A0A9W4SEM7_9GLOM|nr:12590_t:CDS:1 [Funneliformis geosporum]CAI2168840.1 18180_t:CDS:1 [Funneliformis geosporum]
MTSHSTQDDNGFSNLNIIQNTTSSNGSASMPQEIVFYYMPNNDFQIYFIHCKEITFNELISQLLNNNLYSTYNCHNSNNIFVFYFQHPTDQKIYRVTSEMTPHSYIVQYLNFNFYGIEIKQSEQQQHHHQNLEFSNKHKQNLEFHLRQFLIGHLSV